MGEKIKVGLLFGGKSAEHEVSLHSAKNVLDAIDKDKYEPVLIGIDKEGCWRLEDAEKALQNPDAAHLVIGGDDPIENLALVPGKDQKQIVKMVDKESIGDIEVVFPVLHGPFGEDGTMQGLLKLVNVPFVGAGVVGSAIGMDKDVMKRLLKEAEIPSPKFLVMHRTEKDQINFVDVEKRLGMPLFIKPCNLGSSVGVTKAGNEKGFFEAVDEAFKFDRKIIVEENIRGREIECSVLGNEEPIASVPGEVITDMSRHGFYSYEAKYLDENGALLEIPAKLPSDTTKRVQELAIKTFKVLCCEGMARVDFFLNESNKVIVNEINTLPGFTEISMYPKLWKATGMSYTELVDRLIQLAIDRHKKESEIKTSYDF